MKCRKQPLFSLPEAITHVWEVILDAETWQSVVHAARLTNTTYSWVVRYCVFSLLDETSLFETQEFRSVPPCSRKSGHRHHLCLYGDDEKHLKLVAVQLNVPVSKIIRLALSIFLARLIEANPPKYLMIEEAIKKVQTAVTTYKKPRLYLSLQKTLFYMKARD